MYIYNYFTILLGGCIFYDTRFDMIHDTKKKKKNLIHDMIHDLTSMSKTSRGIRLIPKL